MGCDDHSFLEWNEIGDAADPYFEFVAEIELGRYYGLYSVMAGVRAHAGDDPPIFPPRGLPERLSMPVDWEYRDWAGDAHHATWFNVDELNEVQRRFCLLPGGKGQSHKVLAGVIRMMDILNDGDGSRTRLIVWWDN